MILPFKCLFARQTFSQFYYAGICFLGRRPVFSFGIRVHACSEDILLFGFDNQIKHKHCYSILVSRYLVIRDIQLSILVSLYLLFLCYVMLRSLFQFCCSNIHLFCVFQLCYVGISSLDIFINYQFINLSIFVLACLLVWQTSYFLILVSWYCFLSGHPVFSFVIHIFVCSIYIWCSISYSFVWWFSIFDIWIVICWTSSFLFWCSNFYVCHTHKNSQNEKYLHIFYFINKMWHNKYYSVTRHQKSLSLPPV